MQDGGGAWKKKSNSRWSFAGFERSVQTTRLPTVPFPESQSPLQIKEEKTTHCLEASQCGDDSTFPGMSSPDFRHRVGAIGCQAATSDLLSHPSAALYEAFK